MTRRGACVKEWGGAVAGERWRGRDEADGGARGVGGERGDGVVGAASPRLDRGSGGKREREGVGVGVDRARVCWGVDKGRVGVGRPAGPLPSWAGQLGHSWPSGGASLFFSSVFCFAFLLFISLFCFILF